MLRPRRLVLATRMLLTIIVLGICAYPCQAQEQTSAPSGAEKAAGLFERYPTVRLNPIERCPLVALIDFEAPANLSVVVTTTDGRSTWSQPYSSATLKSNSVPTLASTDETSEVSC
jgi:hypothetical protein